MNSFLDKLAAAVLGILLLAMILVPTYHLFFSVLLFEPRTMP